MTVTPADTSTPVTPKDANWAESSTESAFERSNLTKSQFLIWTGQKLHPDVPLYNMILAFTLTGRIDPDRFQRAFQAVVDRTDALRLVIEEHDDVPRQRVQDHLNAEVDTIDLSDQRDPNSAYRTWLDRRRTQMLDLTQRLFDCALVKLATDRHVWFLNQHHLIADVWSTSLVYRRTVDLYKTTAGGQPVPAITFPPFLDYIQYERSHRDNPAFQRARHHWQKKHHPPPPPPLLYDKPQLTSTPNTVRVVCDLGVERSRRLRALATDNDIRGLTLDVTLFGLFLTTLFAWLHRVCGNRDLAIGAPSHNRPSAVFKQTVGLFIEVHPLRVTIAEQETFLSLLKKVTAEIHAFQRHAHPGTSDFSGNNAYRVLLNYIHTSFPDFDGLHMVPEWVHPGHGDAGHTLRLQVHDLDQSGRFVLHFDINRDNFDRPQRDWVVQHFLRLLDGFIANHHQPLAAVSLLSPEETQQDVTVYNQTQTAYPADRTVVKLFEQRVRQAPDAPAVVLNNQTLTYGQLNAKANQLAHYLRSLGVAPGTFVGIMMPRSIELVVAIWGVLKAGGAYVPLDPDYPAQRLAFMMRIAQTPVVLSQQDVQSNLPSPSVRVVCLDRDWATIATHKADHLTDTADMNDPAYVIFTSGSTGQPKGVVVAHRGLTNYAWWAKRQYLGDQILDFPFYTSFGFDLTVTSIFVPLIAGGRVVVYPHAHGKADLTLLRVLEDNQVGVIKLTPSHLSLVKDGVKRPSRLKALIVGGEDLKTDLAKAVTQSWEGKVAIYNEYGPTEATVGCMIHRYDPAVDTGTSVPIGRPADNVRVYLLDQHLKPVTRGMPGQIYIGGDGLAKGYLRQPELTDERFVADPFQPGQKMYRTGDRARWTDVRQMAFMGRDDGQVKIGGVRVEPGEVEAALSTQADIQECVVDVYEKLVPSNGQDIVYCRRCGLASNAPGTAFNADGVCNTCTEFDKHQDKAQGYFKTMTDLRTIVARAKATKSGPHDCVMLLSGGKDSTYALYQMVEMGANPLVFSLDNGFISDGAKANIQRAVDDLGLELIWGQTPAMNEIFVDSLKRYSNVCNGCFKTIYTLSMNLAKERGIRYIVTGLSRGQFFETRISDLFKNRVFDPDQIDQTITEARKAYHRMDDAVSRHLDVRIFQDDAVFEEIHFVDFYRYCDVPLDQMLAFLNQRAPWARPADTGRSTNCLINDVGIYIHKKERGFHNYAMPYSWDVRLGHKDRHAALEELNDQIDEQRVEEILDQIGYGQNMQATETAGSRLVAYYVSNEPLTVSDLRSHLSQNLPETMIPSYFVRLDKIPLTTNGKVDRAALPGPDHGRPQLNQRYVPPRNQIERQLAQIWAHVLGVERVGIHDDFFELGGDSIINIQIIARANRFGLGLTSQKLFEHPTVAGLATVADQRAVASHLASEDGVDSHPIRQPSGDTTETEQVAPFSLVNLDDQKLEQITKLLHNDDTSNLGDGH